MCKRPVSPRGRDSGVTGHLHANGHLSAEMHVTLLWEAGAYLLLAATVIALGDGTSTSPSAQAARDWDRKRAHLETFFSGQNRRGFQFDCGHPRGLTRVILLIMAVCLTCPWDCWRVPRIAE